MSICQGIIWYVSPDTDRVILKLLFVSSTLLNILIFSAIVVKLQLAVLSSHKAGSKLGDKRRVENQQPDSKCFYLLKVPLIFLLGRYL